MLNPDPTDPRTPRHIAIIMDGNGRWAQARGRPRTEGHRHGAEAVKRTLQAAADLGIEYLTLFGFSSENWSRPASEVTELMRLMRLYLRSETAELHRKGVRLRVIGDRDRLARDIVEMINYAEQLTAGNETLKLNIAISYGGREEITRAVRRIANAAATGDIDPSSICESTFSDFLDTRDTPDPDLVIRTSGENRISNFLLWQIAYAELMFSPTLWPDFSKQDLIDAITEYQRRDRRFGAVAGISP